VSVRVSSPKPTVYSDFGWDKRTLLNPSERPVQPLQPM
jgi:hypothetical protein